MGLQGPHPDSINHLLSALGPGQPPARFHTTGCPGPSADSQLMISTGRMGHATDSIYGIIQTSNKDVIHFL